VIPFCRSPFVNYLLASTLVCTLFDNRTYTCHHSFFILVLSSSTLFHSPSISSTRRYKNKAMTHCATTDDAEAEAEFKRLFPTFAESFDDLIDEVDAPTDAVVNQVR
jgi:hypothetical protein